VLVLPDRHGFRGTRIEDPTRSFAGRTSFRGVVACVPWPCEQAAARLPDGLELAPAVAPRGHHPVVLLFGEQREPALLRGGFALPMGPTYGELGIFVPYVRPVARSDLCTFASRMWSTYFPAVWEGNHRYFAKDSASMRITDDQFVAADVAARPLVHAVEHAAGGWERVRPGVPPGLDAIRDAFALPILGRPTGGRLARSYFDWDFAAASARPVQASVWLDGALVGEAERRELDVAPGDAVAVRDMTWRLGWPGAFTA
jgi:hypothetical protein